MFITIMLACWSIVSARDLTFTPHKSEYEVGEEINCTVLGNPEPEVTWSPISTPSSVRFSN